MFSPVSSRVFFGHRHKNRGKLSDLVAEHLDHLHYLNDILIINCEFLNDVLTDHLLNRLFLPLYVYSLVNPEIVCYFNPVPFTTAFFCQHSDLFFFLARVVSGLCTVSLTAGADRLSGLSIMQEDVIGCAALRAGSSHGLCSSGLPAAQRLRERLLFLFHSDLCLFSYCLNSFVCCHLGIFVFKLTVLLRLPFKSSQRQPMRTSTV